MVFRWREIHTPVVLELLRRHECLWNNKIDAYKNKSAREKALQEIVKGLNLAEVTVYDIKAKIKTIRTRYAVELAKVLKSDASDVYVPKLFWFSQANSFLRAVCVPRNSAVPTYVSNSKTEETEAMDEEINGENDRASNSRSSHPSVIQQAEAHKAESSSSSEFGVECTASGHNRTTSVAATSAAAAAAAAPKHGACCSRKRGVDSSSLASLENEVNMKFQKISQQASCTAENEFDVFCKCLAIQLKSMPLDRALLCQEKLMSVMVQERLDHIRNHPADQALTAHQYGHDGAPPARAQNVSNWVLAYPNSPSEVSSVHLSNAASP